MFHVKKFEEVFILRFFVANLCAKLIVFSLLHFKFMPHKIPVKNESPAPLLFFILFGGIFLNFLI